MALLGYLADNLPDRVDAVFSRAESNATTLIIPSIVIGESIFTLLKGRDIFGSHVDLGKLEFFLDSIELSRSVIVSDVTTEGWKRVMSLDLPELHDRMIVATHILSECRAILTNDNEISAMKNVKTIWN